MIRNYLFTILRQLKKHRTFSFINVIGLAVGMSACLIIAHYGYFHYNFDTYHSKADRIFRIHRTAMKNGINLGETAQASSMMIRKIHEQNPHVLNAARIFSVGFQNNALEGEVKGKIISYKQEQIYAVDPSIFDIVDFEFLSGSEISFDRPETIILSESTARRFFEDFETAIGSKLTLSGNSGSKSFEVVGILKDLPVNTHFQFECLLSMKSIENYTNSLDSWTGGNYFGYLLLDNPESKGDIIEMMENLYDENARTLVESYGYTITSFDLLNIKDVHVKSEAGYDFSKPINENLLMGLISIALVILTIAWINYLNLSLVKTIERLKEVGIRRALGSSTGQISYLFIIDSLVLNFMAFLIAVTLVQVFAPYINSLTGIPFQLSEMWYVIGFLTLIILVGSTVVGLYPTAMIRTVKTVEVLQKKNGHKLTGRINLRSFLVTLQFIVTFLLISVTITVYNQITYMKSADLGFRKSDIMVIQSPPGDVNQSASEREDIKRFNTFKTALKSQSGIKAITNAGELPGSPIDWNMNLYLDKKGPNESIDTRLISMGSEFIDFFELDIVAGRGVQPGDDPWSKKDVFVNVKMTEELGFENPENAIGAKISGFYAPLEIRGVIENHHHNSLHEQYQPIAYILSSWTEYYFIRFNIGDDLHDLEHANKFAQLTSIVEEEWAKAFPNRQLNYFYLDQFYNRQYAEDENFGNLFSTFSILAIIIASLGLFGLTSFTLKQRTKEIGIRKVLGAGSNSLILLLSRGYFLVILIAYIIATPIAWILLSRWLENYAFHIELNIWIFIVPLVLVFVTAFLTLISRILMTIRLNPVHSLRTE